MSPRIADTVLDFELQLTDRHKVATPADWRRGDHVIILPSVDDEGARALFPEGWLTVKPYLRTVPQPVTD